ncbi:MAG TPA: DinB family protein [Verrucomicrobiae bacterium]|nr:DinB family protein [Verrucomicrobiae bacterium]
MNEKALREQLAKMLDWGEAHADWKSAVKDFPAVHRGTRPPGSPHSAWELLEHIRLAQFDILEFSRNPHHASPPWPEGYWPKEPAPPTAAAWEKTVKQIEADQKSMQKLVEDPKTDLLAPIPHGSGQTILREILLLADHNSYHLGQLVLVRKLLGDWKAS